MGSHVPGCSRSIRASLHACVPTSGADAAPRCSSRASWLVILPCPWPERIEAREVARDQFHDDAARAQAQMNALLVVGQREPFRGLDFNRDEPTVPDCEAVNAQVALARVPEPVAESFNRLDYGVVVAVLAVPAASAWSSHQ